jgi:hypothetical protein
MSHKKALAKKNIVDKAPLAEAAAVAFTTTILPSNTEKAASTAIVATTATTPTPADEKAATTTKPTPADNKAVKSASPPASDERPLVGAMSLKTQYLLFSAKALAEATAGHRQSSAGSELEKEGAFFCN